MVCKLCVHYTNIVRGRLVPKNENQRIFRDMSSLHVRNIVRPRPKPYAAWELRQEVATAIAKIKRLKRKSNI